MVTKLTPPPISKNQVLRESLLARMGENDPGRKLILVHAPAGFGKTSLLLQYHEARRREGITALWMNMDNADNDLDRFVLHLQAGWKRATSRQSNTPLQDPPGLIEQLASYGSPFSLILDEFESIQSPSVLNFIEQVLDYLPAHGELVLGSRHLPSISLGRMRTRGQLLELSHTDLRLNFAESTAMLDKQLRRSLKPQDVTILHERTEGWPAAIHLAALALPDHVEPGNFFASFSGSHAELAQFLAEDILEKLSDDERGFLLQTSILHELNAGLCDWLTNREDSQLLLEQLSRANLFLVPLNNEHSSYRYHGLFASFLYERLKATSSLNIFELHRRAASWYLHHDRPIPAIEHLLQDHDQHAAVALLSEHAEGLLAEGRVRRLLRWFDLLQPGMVNQLQEPQLNLSRAWALVLNRHHAQAQPIIDGVLQAATNEESRRLVNEAQTLQCLQLSMTDHIAASHKASAQQLKELEPDQYLENGVLSSIVAYCMIALSQYDDARQIMSQAMQRDHQLRTTFVRSLSDAHDGSIDLIQARLGLARVRLEGSYERAWMSSSKTLPGGKATIGVPLAEVLYELDELERAQHVLGECLAYARENGTVDALITSFLLLSRIAFADGDRESALHYLKELEEIATDTGLERAGASAKLEFARVLWLEGDSESADQKLQGLKPLDIWQKESAYQLPAQDIETPELLDWRLRVSAGDAHTVVPELKQAMKAAISSRRNRRALKLRILLSVAQKADGKLGTALQSLTEALQIASKEGFIRTFLDEGSSVEELLNSWFKQHGEIAERQSISSEFLNRLRSRLSVQPQAPRSASPIREALTRRELQVVQQLSEGARNRTMAERMFVSETTIKAHLRNISAKLGANSRTEAVAIARRLGLI